jgi:hypothetical protein
MTASEPCTGEGDYDDVHDGSMSCRCAPAFPFFDPDGIRIRMPEKVTVTPGAVGIAPTSKLPVCIVAKFNNLFLKKFWNKPFRQALRVVLVDDTSDTTYHGSIWRDRLYMSTETPSTVSDEQLAKQVLSNFVNANLLEYFKLPARPAVYRVYVTLEGHKSNVCTVELALKS